MNARFGILASLLLVCFPQRMHAAPPDWTGYYTLSIANAVVMEDRHALVNAHTFTRYYTKQVREFPENVCNEDVEVWKQFKDDAFKRRYEHSKEIK